MRTSLLFKAIFTLGLLALQISGQSLRSESDNDYAIGQLIGSCVPDSCQIFIGQLMAVRPQSRGVVHVKVVEGLWGITADAGTLQLPYAEESRGKSTDQLGLAWSNALVGPGALVTVTLARTRIRATNAGEPLYVTSDQHDSEVVRYLARETRAAASDGYSLSDAVDSLSRKENPPLAGYLFATLTERTFVNRPGLALILLSRMMGSTSVPDVVREYFAMKIIVSYDRLSRNDRATVIANLGELTRATNPRSAAAAFKCLGRIGTFDESAWTGFSPLALEQIGAAYRDLRDKGTLPRGDALDVRFGKPPR